MINTGGAPARVEAGSSSGAERGIYAGWLAGLLVIVAILAVGAYLWFTHHP